MADSADPFGDFVDARALIKGLKEEGRHVLASGQQLAKAHPGWDSTTDARLTPFGKLHAVLGPAQLALWFSVVGDRTDRFWLGITGNTLPREEVPEFKRKMCWNFGQFLKFAILHSVFSCMESTLRVLLRAIAPEACNKGNATLGSLYPCLFKKIGFGDKYDTFMVLLSCIRNTVHNNGFFYPTNHKNKSIEYGGRTYVFEVGRAPACLDWNDLFGYLRKIGELLVDVAESPGLSSKTSIFDETGGSFADRP